MFRDLAAGTYTFTVTELTGDLPCVLGTIVNTACPLTIADILQLATDCSGMNNTVIRLTIAGNDGAVNTTWTGDNNVEIFNGQQEAGPLPPGIYFVSISDQVVARLLTKARSS